MRFCQFIFILMICSSLTYALENEQQNTMILDDNIIETDNVASDMVYGYRAKRIQANNTIPLMEKYGEVQDYISSVMQYAPISSSLYTQDCVMYEPLQKSVISTIASMLQGIGYETAMIKDPLRTSEMYFLFYAENKNNLQNAVVMFLDSTNQTSNSDKQNSDKQNKENDVKKSAQYYEDKYIFNSTQDLIRKNNEKQSEESNSESKENKDDK